MLALRDRGRAGAIGFAAIGLLALIVAGCGGGSSSDATPSPTSAATAVASPSSVVATAAASASTGASPTPTQVPTATAAPSPAPDGPVVRLGIPTLGIDAPVEDRGIDATGRLDQPVDREHAVAWYGIYDRPNRVNPANTGWVMFGGRTEPPTVGNSVFYGRQTVDANPGPFARLAAVKAGDPISVVVGGGAEYRYAVRSAVTTPLAQLDIRAILWPPAMSAERITVMADAGPSAQLVVVAERVP